MEKPLSAGKLLACSSWCRIYRHPFAPPSTTRIPLRYIKPSYTTGIKTKAAKKVYAKSRIVFSKKSQSAKIEINYILRSHAQPFVGVTASANGVFPGFSVRILAPVEILASKIVALFDRAAARDLIVFSFK